ncbi:MAG: response regulator [Treponema sp.]|jgi:putative two-component system response regulator|nr:response regulator [Treponema sp.]
MSKDRQVIMLVDDNMANLATAKLMLKGFYEVYPIPSGEKLFAILEKVVPDLILLDVEMSGMSGYQVLEKLRADAQTQDIPVIFLTAKSDAGSELRGLTLGAIDYIFKPFSPILLRKRIENHLLLAAQKKQLKDYNDNLQKMVEERTGQVVKLQNAILQTVAELVEFRDNTTGGHIGRTQRYLKLLVDKLIQERIYEEEVSRWNQEFLVPSAQLHDVGKIGIPDSILNKPGRLTPDEFEIMKNHTTIGKAAIDEIMRITKEHDFLAHAGIFAYTHHEKWDGSGYPRGLKGDAIPLQGRLMAIADVYDALIAARPYKKPISTDDAKRIMLEGRGSHFDPVLADLFDSLSDEFAQIAKTYNLEAPDAEAR